MLRYQSITQGATQTRAEERRCASRPGRSWKSWFNKRKLLLHSKKLEKYNIDLFKTPLSTKYKNKKIFSLDNDQKRNTMNLIYCFLTNRNYIKN